MVATFSNPVDRDADDRRANHGQVEDRGGLAHTDSILPGTYIQIVSPGSLSDGDGGTQSPSRHVPSDALSAPKLTNPC